MTIVFNGQAMGGSKKIALLFGSTKSRASSNHARFGTLIHPDTLVANDRCPASQHTPNGLVILVAFYAHLVWLLSSSQDYLPLSN